MAGPQDSESDLRWLRQAVELSRRCPPSGTAFSVGAVLVTASGEIATGYSRERGPKDHAEEVALAKAAERGLNVRGGTLYSSLEPCAERASRPVPCARLIAAAGIARVVIAWLEPPLFARGGGAAWLRAHGVPVGERTELAAAARSVNAHLLGTEADRK
jgi:diaminohydroxyphosphoribosylaminopyrimidine deaminase/5-amino-6-(5-phosphoribosylamino)uracil reductase